MMTADRRAPIHLFVPTFRVEETLAAVRECLERGWTGLGFKTVEIEEQWKAYTGLPHAHFLNSNTSGLHLAVEVLKRRLGWRDGDEVISTPLTFVSTNQAILYAGLTPVFADIDETLCLDPESVLSTITPHTRAVIFVGIGGNPGAYAEILRICRDRGLALILDAAHMAGSRLGGTHVGVGADATVFSFQAVKNLPTGDSGMLCFAEADDDSLARRLSWLGISKDTYARTQSGGTYAWMYDVDDLGYKYNGNSVMAAMALVALRYLDEDNAERRRLSALYDELLGSSNAVGRIPMAPDSEPSRHLYQVRVGDRDAVLSGLNRRGIHPGVHYRDNSDYGVFAPYALGATPRAAAASASLLSLPLHLRLTDDDVRHVATNLLDLLA
jgi:dTDP-4-amino-4,6-dideoxygalactose transaminase